MTALGSPQPRSDEPAHMRHADEIPWQRFVLLMLVPPGEIDLSVLRRVLNGDENDDRSDWKLFDSDRGLLASAKTTVFQRPQGENQTEMWPEPVGIEIHARHAPAGTEFSGVPFTDFLTVVSRAVAGASDVACTAIIWMTYPETAAWRLPLLSETQRVDVEGSGLGAVSLSGITLRFSDSTAGLLQAELSTALGKESRRAKLIFGFLLSHNDITKGVAEVFSRSARFADLFISARTSPPDKEGK